MGDDHQTDSGSSGRDSRQEPVQDKASGRVDRVFQLTNALRAESSGEAGVATAERLAASLGVSVRTIYRDIETLRANGYPIEGAPGVGYRLAPSVDDGAAHGAHEAASAVVALSAVLPETPPPPSALRGAIRAAYRATEPRLMASLAQEARFPPDAALRVFDRAAGFVSNVRSGRRNEGGIDLFMHEYALSSEEGVALMCLAEALLRIPDSETADALIEDKIGGANWQSHFGRADSLFVNASTLGLMISGRVLRLGVGGKGGLQAILGRLVQRSGEPVIRAAVRQAMRIMGRQFVMGRTIAEALDRVRSDGLTRYRLSFDMLGEAAWTEADAARYQASYLDAIARTGKASAGSGPIESHGVSIKLSALFPRYEVAQRGGVMERLYPRLLEAAEAAAKVDIGLCVDAEEADRLELSLDLFAKLAHEPSLKGWDGLGLAVQAYQRRARPLVDWLAALANDSGRRLMARLVKGAYWDAEIKRTQEAGLPDFPVFTRKAHTDVSYIACAKAMLAEGAAFYPCFATHNAQTAAAILELAEGRPREDWEFQRLHGMGAPLYRHIVDDAERPAACRIYAPVGGHEDLLAYLVRRLLENGANSSFVNRMVDDALPVEEIVADPVAQAEVSGFQPHSKIALPGDLYAPRVNSAGLDLSDASELERLARDVTELEKGGIAAAGKGTRPVRNPARNDDIVGHVREARAAEIAPAMQAASDAQPAWDGAGAEARAVILERAADLFEEHRTRLMQLCVREAGKTWKDAVAEIREAVDFLRYYAAETRRLFAEPVALPGPTGERNTLRLAGRGVWVCISPWNFPLAIFTGQVAAALGAGNAVVAKPAEQTPLIAVEAVSLLKQAGVPDAVLQLTLGDGPTLGPALMTDPRLAGVAFTGSTDVARLLARQLTERDGPILPLIAETGGINAMIVDSSALPEQVTRDVLVSGFQSAGQRCSALRVLYVQEEAAERQIAMLKGAMAELKIGDPAWISTDVGPVIDAEARAGLLAHAERLEKDGKLIASAPLPKDLPPGHWVAPRLLRVGGIGDLKGEVFGPMVHVAVWKADQLDKVIAEINAAGYGLTLSVHSRIEARWRQIAGTAKVGNVYINRNQIGAIVGSQPFGGEGLSGTGPKAGGPHYLARFAVERTCSIDLTAQGGDAELMMQEA